MRREDYYRPDDNSRENYRQNDHRNPEQPRQGATYNNYAPQQQAPYYQPRPRHHVFIWILIVILCLGLGWFAADHYLYGDNQASNPSTTYNSSTKNVNNSKTTNNKNTKPQQPQSSQQPKVNELENEMNRLDVTENDQAQAIKFYEGQNQQNQEKIDKMITLINKVVPSDALKKQALDWILH